MTATPQAAVGDGARAVHRGTGRLGRGSWQAHVASLVVRWFVRSRLRRVGTLLEARDALDREHPVPRDVTRRADRAGEIPGEWIEAGTGSGTLLLYLHGGGYFAGSPATHRTITAAFARRGLRVFAADYRLAPEHPFPAALEDSCAAYQALRAGSPAPRRIVLAGDSAGGGLALATLVALRDRGVPLPAACVLFSPWTDLSLSGESMGAPWERAMLDRVRPAAAAYLAGLDPCEPLASPLFADLRGLPPILIHAGADEALCVDSTRLATALRAAGGRVELRLWPVVPHVWQMAPRFLPEARESLDLAAAFLETHAEARVASHSEREPACR